MSQQTDAQGEISEQVGTGIPLPEGADQDPPMATSVLPEPYAIRPRRPRVWPVYVVFPIMMIAGLGIQVAAIALVAIIGVASSGGRLRDSGAIENYVQDLVKNPWAVSLLMLPLLAVEVGAAIIPSILSPTPWRLRLNLRVPLIPWWVVLAASIGGITYSMVPEALSQMLNIQSPAISALNDVISHSTGVNAVVTLFVIGLAGPIAEELFFRGYLQTRLVQRHGAVWGILIAAAFFGLMHLDWLQSPFAFGFGIYIGIMVHRAQSILPGIVAHCLNNSTSVLSAWVPWDLPTLPLPVKLVAGLVLATGLLVPCLMVRPRVRVIA